MNNFEIVYEHTLKIGKLLLNDPSADDFEEKVSIFSNFIKQISQIVSKENHISPDNMTKLRQILDINIKIEQILIAKRNMVKEEIIKNNRKGLIKKTYDKNSSLGYNKKS